MAIKKAPVLSAMQVYMTCDHCGSLMQFDGFDFEDTKMYRYKCSCGHKEFSKQSYPYQQVIFDRSKEETIG